MNNDYTMVTGYDNLGALTMDEYIAYNTAIAGGGSPAPTTTTTVRTWNPAQPAIAGVAAIPPTPAQINYLMSKGWNSWAMSVEQILPGSFIDYTVAAGVNGAFVGIGRAEQSGQHINTFQHGIMIDLSGVWAFESGAKVKQLRALHVGATVIRIYRQANNEIIYMAVTGTESLIHKSAVPAMQIPLYGHGCLYASGDTLNSAAITVGEVQFGSV